MATTLNLPSFKDFQQHCDDHPKQTFVAYKNGVYDVTEFLGDHPGGPELVQDWSKKDITEIFHSEEYHEHSDNGLRMLQKYKVGIIRNQDGDAQEDSGENESYPKITKEKIEYNGFTIDRTRGLVPQVFGLNKKQYMHMIHNSIHLPYCRLFDSDLFESLSRNPWYRIPMIWIPVTLYLIYNGVTFDYPDYSFANKYIFGQSPEFSILAVIAAFFFGIFVWSFAEYSLHRCVFHFDDYTPDHPFALYLHFLIHGIHHLIPMDPDRLVFPPVLGMIVYSILFPTIVFFCPGNFGRLVGAGFIIGYIAYDMTHIYIHHCQPWIAHFKEMKKYHNKHHYIDGNRGYGITTKFWDKIFGTELL